MLDLLARIPLPALHGVARFLALMLEHVVRYRRRVVEENLLSAFPEASPAERAAIKRQFYRNLTDTAVETLKTLRMQSRDLQAHVQLDNPELLAPYIEARQPIMVIGAHQANWEWVFIACGLHLSYPLEGVYRPLHSKYFDRLMQRIRIRFGAAVIADRTAFKHIVANLKTPRAISFVVDQRPSDREDRYWTEFLTQETDFYTGWAKLAQLTRYPVFFADRKRTGRGRYVVSMQLIAREPQNISSRDLIEAFVRALECSIRESPGDWLWSHRRWRHKRPLYN